MIDVELQRRWIEGLRSGRYAQGRGALRKIDCYCCLGVACDVADPAGWDSVPSPEFCSHWGRTATVSAELRSRLGLGGSIDQFDLMRMNDGEGKTFAEIADHLERLFGLSPAGPDPAALDDAG